MKKHQYSEYEKYILMAGKDKMTQTYASFLGFKTIVSFIKEIVGKTGDTFLHNGTIYKKRITSNEAIKFLESLTKGRCDIDVLRKIGTQLCIRV